MEKRRLLAAALILFASSPALFAAGSGEIAPRPSSAAASAAPAPAAAAETIPVTRVVLFSTGVGYFERSGRVAGKSDVVLTVPKGAVNDLLKSLTVRDESGHVRSVDYSSQDPLGRALASFSIDLSDNPSLAELLSRARGAEVSLRTPEPVDGEILSIESRPVLPEGRSAEPATAGAEELYLNLLTASGIRSFKIATLDQIRFEDPRIERDLAAALALMAANRSGDTKRLRIAFDGQGERAVSLSYLLETPVWKTSYRLAVDSAGGSSDKALLQGWAIVDNPTDDDWKDVRLDLVSGMPISFQMDLGTPVYNPRPTVAVPLPPSVTPQTYESAMEAPAPAASAQKSMAPGALRAPARAEERAYAPSAGAAGAGGGFALDAGVEAAARGAAAGEFFQYAIKEPVTLPRRQSAMVPILNQAIEASRVSIYNESVLERHPLAGLRIKNTSGLHLMAGPITVFEDGVYSGDAEIADLAPNEERLVSFAVDLDTDVAASSSSAPEVITSLKIDRGTLYSSTRLERERDYTIVNRGSKRREILVEYPIARDWTLMAPATGVEKTADLYRFAVSTDPASGGRASLAVKEERIVSQSIVLSNLDSRTILFYLGQRAASPALKAALSRLSEMKAKLDDLLAQRKTLQDRADAIAKDQSRIRANMEVLDRTSDLYRRYLASLSSEEDELAAGRLKLDDLSQRIDAARREIDGFVSTLTVS